MVRHDDEIQGPNQLDQQAGMALDRFAPRDAIGLVGTQGGAGESRVGRPRGVQVGVAKERPGGKVVIDVGRVVLRGNGFALVFRESSPAQAAWQASPGKRPQ